MPCGTRKGGARTWVRGNPPAAVSPTHSGRGRGNIPREKLLKVLRRILRCKFDSCPGQSVPRRRARGDATAIERVREFVE